MRKQSCHKHSSAMTHKQHFWRDRIREKGSDLVDSLGGLVLGGLVEGAGGVALKASQLVLGGLLGTLLGLGALLVGVAGGGGGSLLGALVLRLGGLATLVGGRHCCVLC